MKKTIKKLYFVIGIFTALLSATAIALYQLAGWVMDTWGLLTTDEIMYHLKAPLQGTNTDMIVDGIETCLPPAILLLILMITFMIGLKSKRKQSLISMVLVMVIAFAMMDKAAYGMYVDLDMKTYLKSMSQESNFIEDNYVDPENVTITFPEQKRNLVYIYLESMESTYASKEEGGLFEENCIPELTELAQQNVNFSNTDKLGGGYATTGATWTMAGIFAQTIGLPLKLSDSIADGDGNYVLAENYEFSANATNLEDILAENGYTQCFMLGSDIVFGGRQAYFDSHGECEIWDYNTAKQYDKIDEDYYVWWGFEDEKLFEYAKEKMTDLASSEEPFNLTLLTADTHFEDGYVCDLCGDEFGDDQYANVMACSSRQVAELIQWIQEQPFYENTTIILSGDHLTMDKDFCIDCDSYERRVYNAFINVPEELDSSFEKTHNREFTTLDMFPTTLAALGATIEGDRLALGTNLFSDEDTLTEKYGINEFNTELMKKSLFYNVLINDIDYDY